MSLYLVGVSLSPSLSLTPSPCSRPLLSLSLCLCLCVADESREEGSFYELLPCCARVRCADQILEGQWHHLVVVMSKGMLKNSMASLYLDGQLLSTVKVSQPPYLCVPLPRLNSSSRSLFLPLSTSI